MEAVFKKKSGTKIRLPTVPAMRLGTSSQEHEPEAKADVKNDEQDETKQVTLSKNGRSKHR